MIRATTHFVFTVRRELSCFTVMEKKLWHKATSTPTETQHLYTLRHSGKLWRSPTSVCPDTLLVGRGLFTPKVFFGAVCHAPRKAGRAGKALYQKCFAAQNQSQQVANLDAWQNAHKATETAIFYTVVMRFLLLFSVFEFNFTSWHLKFIKANNI